MLNNKSTNICKRSNTCSKRPRPQNAGYNKELSKSNFVDDLISRKHQKFSIDQILEAKNTSSESLIENLECSLEAENSNLWKNFYKLQTEMIITKPGRRMFPTLKIVLTNCDPQMNYYVYLDIIPVDSNRYRYHYDTSSWCTSGKAEQTPQQSFQSCSANSSGSNLDTPVKHFYENNFKNTNVTPKRRQLNSTNIPYTNFNNLLAIPSQPQQNPILSLINSNSLFQQYYLNMLRLAATNTNSTTSLNTSLLNKNTKFLTENHSTLSNELETTTAIDTIVEIPKLKTGKINKKNKIKKKLLAKKIRKKLEIKEI